MSKDDWIIQDLLKKSGITVMQVEHEADCPMPKSKGKKACICESTDISFDKL